MKQKFILSVDIGQVNDYTACVILERQADEDSLVPRTKLLVRHIERFKLGTSYPHQVNAITALASSRQLARDVYVVFDQTGVGRPIGDMLRYSLRSLYCPITGINITGGAGAHRHGAYWNVPKNDLIASAQIALQNGTLKIASQLKSAHTLTEELTSYRVKISEEGSASYGNGRDAPNDDLVLACAMGCYVANNYRTRARMVAGGMLGSSVKGGVVGRAT